MVVMRLSRLPTKSCVRCRGGRNLCGLTYCPILIKDLVSNLGKLVKSNSISGSTPPSVFIGRYGYPYVRAGPALPPVIGDTSIYDLPEAWVNLPLNDILTYRYSLVRGVTITPVNDLNNRLTCMMQELMMSLRPVDIEVYLEKPPKPKLYLDEYLPPQGPSAPLREFRLSSNPIGDRRIERVFHDLDLKAIEGVIRLYKDGIPVSTIQKLLSVGCLGISRSRKLVPTRWSITAVDSVISHYLINEVRKLPLINKYLLYIREFMDNLFIGILAPRPWSYEWMEAWFPGSTWNKFGLNVEIEGDYEGFKGRTEYPGIGGCYFAARLASAEALLNIIGRQATVVLWREIYEGFNLPVGVWFVRENLRAMFKSEPLSFNTLEELIKHLKDLRITRVSIDTWIKKSFLIRSLITQESLDKFIW